MGSGGYSSTRSAGRTVMYASMDRGEIFTKKAITNLMNPKNTLRECCDSDEHPNSVPIIIGLDVTGSMGHVPEAFIREEMANMLEGLYAAGLTDSQVLFVGIGDHECDRSPLQTGQFEADDQLLDKWLKDIYLEGGGGGNDGESYLLAWYYAARHTKIDSFNKRQTKGFVFTIGDEHNLSTFPANAQKQIFGDNGVYEDVSADALLNEASKMYNVYHIHLTETRSGSRKVVADTWKQNLNDNALILDSYKDIAKTIINTVKENVSSSTVSKTETVQESTEAVSVAEEVML